MREVKPIYMEEVQRVMKLVRICERHRQWGWDCPAEDLDFLEYDYARAVALVEYKDERGGTSSFGAHNLRALVDLADRASLPAFLTRHDEEFSLFRVYGLNTAGRALVTDHREMNEEAYVRFLYTLRGRRLPPDLEAQLRVAREG